MKSIVRNRLTIKYVLPIYLLFLPISAAMSQDYFRVAVVDYAPRRELYYLPHEILIKNANEYVQLVDQITSSENVSIIIFPEYGLTTLEVLQKVPEHLESYSIEIPSSQNNYINPCFSSGEYHKVLTDISCVASRTNTYIVAHILEKEKDEKKYNFYSTNLVFDNNGTISHKYRKINLHLEENMQSGKEQVNYFKTNFGATFGLLMGADIISKSDHSWNLTNVIYTTAWPSETPFLYGLSIQQGYAKSNKVNLITACLNDPSNNSSGSEIYFANGSIATYRLNKAYISTEKKVIIADMPKRPGLEQTNVQVDENSRTDSRRSARQAPTSDHILHLKIEDISNYTLESIDTTKGLVRNCSKINKFCCYAIHPNQSEHNNQSKTEYEYKLVSFFGVRQFNYRTIGISVCAVVFCSTNNSSSCGLKNNDSQMLAFDTINITVRHKNDVNIDLRPITLDHNLEPITSYSIDNNAVVGYRVYSRSINDKVLTYGVFGRIFDYDGLDPGCINKLTESMKMPSGESSTRDFKNTFTIILIILFSIYISIVDIQYIFFKYK